MFLQAVSGVGSVVAVAGGGSVGCSGVVDLVSSSLDSSETEDDDVGGDGRGDGGGEEDRGEDEDEEELGDEDVEEARCGGGRRDVRVTWKWGKDLEMTEVLPSDLKISEKVLSFVAAFGVGAESVVVVIDKEDRMVDLAEEVGEDAELVDGTWVTSFALHEVVRGDSAPAVECGGQSGFVAVAVVSEGDELVFSGCLDRRVKCGFLLEVCVGLWMKCGRFLLEEESPNVLAEGAKLDVNSQLPVDPLRSHVVFRLVECEKAGCCTFPRVDGVVELVLPDLWKCVEGSMRDSGVPRRVTISRPVLESGGFVSAEDSSDRIDPLMRGGVSGRIEVDCGVMRIRGE